jgi:hypothetical protein
MELTRKPITGPLHINRAHGIYTSKQKVPLGNDLWGKPLVFNCTLAPFYEDHKVDARARGKASAGCRRRRRARGRRGSGGHAPPSLVARDERTEKALGPLALTLPRLADAPPPPSPPLPVRPQQVITSVARKGQYFDKLTYAAEAYEDAGKKGAVRKPGFGSGLPLNRDDLSNVIEIGRYRHRLMTEAKSVKKASDRVAAATGQLPGGDTTSGSRAPAHGSAAELRSTGLAGVIPRFQSAYDRGRHVAEFSTRKLPAEMKYTRAYGPVRSTSSEIGEGCFEDLKPPAEGKGDFSKAFASRFVHPTVFGMRTVVQ